MRVFGLKPPVKNLAWRLGGLFLLVAAFYPPLPIPLSALYTFYSSNWTYDFLQVGATGGPGWQLLHALRWHTLGLSTLLYDFFPLCFVPVVLPLCAILSWKFLVYRAERPTLIRGLGAVLSALILSLLTVFLLDWIGGRIFLTIFPASPRGASIARGLISLAWSNAITQSILLLFPCLIVGGALAYWQEKLWRRYME